MTDKPTLDAFGVVVADMPRALAFYRELGLDLPAEADEQPHVEVELGGGVRLMFDTVETIRSFDPDWQPPTGGHRMGMAFQCPDPASVDAIHRRLVGMSHPSHKDPWDAFWGQRYAQLLDPDGNTVDLYAPLA
jgi:catechol 2,3-dioxygenase-like lactoylglutathione lyase family enzyme